MILYMSKSFSEVCWIISFIVGTTLLIWLPHLFAVPNFWNLDFSKGFATIYRNYDGLNYVVIAKTFYDPTLIAQIPQSLPDTYFAAHFPGYPILIALAAPLFGYLKSMLLVTIIFTIASALSFYFFVKNFKLSEKPFLLTLVFTILPARWIIVRSVGSPEPVFIFFIILSLYFLLKAVHLEVRQNLIWISAIFAALALLVRPPGVLLVLSYFFYALYSSYKLRSFKHFLKFWPFALVPLVLVGIFSWYGLVYNDFFAYFHSGDNIHLTLPPFSVFNSNQFWVGTTWLEDVVYIFILELLGGLILFSKKLYPLAFFVLTYLGASFFVAHRDISRYTLPVVPFVLMAFEKVLTSKEFKIVLVVLGLAFYLYTQNYLLQNTAPVADLSAYN